VSFVAHDRAIIEWETNEPATATLAYGTSTSLGQTVNVAAASSKQQATLQGLAAQTHYYLRIAVTDVAGNGPVQSAMVDFYTRAAPDTTPPLYVSGPLLVDRSDTAVTLTLATDEPSTVAVTVAGSGAGTGTVPFTELSTAHTVRIPGLSPATTYTLTVGATDALGNGPRNANPISVTTRPLPDTTPPVFTEHARLCQLASDNAAVCWSTDEPASTVVEYGPAAGGALGLSVARTELLTSQSVPLVRLTPDTDYLFRVRVRDAAGNETVSADTAFRTGAAPDVTPPVFVVAPRVVYVSGDRVVLEWQTDEPSEGIVEYGPSAVRELRASDPGRKMYHQVTLTNLVPGTQYYVRVIATDAAGNAAAMDLQ
jgi:phosphodiesterase/alkaline phosphatase D-like protein